MDAAQLARRQEKQKLLARLTELMGEEQTEEGVFAETPQFSVLERTFMWLGRELSGETQQLREVCRQRGIDPDQRLEHEAPDRPLCEAIRYLTNNRSRMDCPQYRRAGWGCR